MCRICSPCSRIDFLAAYAGLRKSSVLKFDFSISAYSFCLFPMFVIPIFQILLLFFVLLYIFRADLQDTHQYYSNDRARYKCNYIPHASAPPSILETDKIIQSRLSRQSQRHLLFRCNIHTKSHRTELNLFQLMLAQVELNPYFSSIPQSPFPCQRLSTAFRLIKSSLIVRPPVPCF